MWGGSRWKGRVVTTENLIPLTAVIEITEACNENCLHCYRPPLSKEYWTLERFDKVCAELAAIGSLQIDFTGGEPFVKKDFGEYLRIAHNHGFIISILTNGTLIDEKIIETLKSIKLRHIYVSIYSSDAVTHDLITQAPGSFHKTITAINKLQAAKVPVFINSPIMDVNRDSPVGIKALSDKLGLDVKFSFKISHSYNQDRNTTTLNCFSKELSRMIKDPQVQLYSEIIDKIKSSSSLGKQRFRSCDAGFRSITISPEGDIIPCTALRMKCGNIGEADLSQLWKGSDILKYWREKGSSIKESCKLCSSYDFCEPCPAGYYAIHRNLDGIDETTCGFEKAFSSCFSCN